MESHVLPNDGPTSHVGDLEFGLWVQGSGVRACGGGGGPPFQLASTSVSAPAPLKRHAVSHLELRKVLHEGICLKSYSGSNSG